MNEFTKEELITLKNGVEYLSDRTSLSEQYVKKCEAITTKIQSLIDKLTFAEQKSAHEAEERESFRMFK